MTTNIFNFADLTDIAETNPELAAKVANKSQAGIDTVVSIFEAAAAASAGAITIAQLQVAAVRMGIELPAAPTVLKYINSAIEQGSVARITRQTYAAVAETADVSEVGAPDVAAPAVEDLGDELPE